MILRFVAVIAQGSRPRATCSGPCRIRRRRRSRHATHHDNADPLSGGEYSPAYSTCRRSPALHWPSIVTGLIITQIDSTIAPGADTVDRALFTGLTFELPEPMTLALFALGSIALFVSRSSVRK